MYCKSAIVSFWKPPLIFWECIKLCIVLCFLVQVLMKEAAKEPVEKYCIAVNVKWKDANMNDCKCLNFQDN